MSVENLLFLVHRIPFPPNKGDKIRSYHLLRHLARRYRVHLGTFIDDPNDWQHADAVKQLCAGTYFARLNPRLARLRSLSAFTGGRPLTIDYYRDAGMRSWVARTLEEQRIGKIVVFSSGMAQFADHARQARRIIDFVDIDSDKWAQYAASKSGPASWLYRRESRALLRYERKLAGEWDASLFVSKAEADLFRKLAPESGTRIGFFNNGVDTDYFSPCHTFPSPYQDKDQDKELGIVFTGAMDYWPNVDAVQWFAREIFPSVLRAHPDARFHIVGSRPAPEVRALAALPGINVTGAVPDVRPYIAHARVAIAPLRIARGIQNKVLEAMAMAKPIVVSAQALEGIDATPGSELLLAEDAARFAQAVSQLLGQDAAAMGRAARARVEARYGWDANLAKIDILLGDEPGSAAEHKITASEGAIP